MTQTLTLRDLTDEVLALDHLIAMDDGEWTDEHEALANELTEKLVRKTDSFASYLQDLDARAAVIRDEEKRLAERRRRLERDVERLERYALDAMQRMGESKLTGTLHTIAVRKNPPSVVVNEPVALHSESTKPYIVEEVVRRIDKAAVKRDLLLGVTIPGCELAQSMRVEVK